MNKNFDLAVSDLIHAIGLLVRRVRAEAGGDGLSMSESAVLKRLDKEGPATTADLARAESVRPQSMGATVAALEEAGLVERLPHPTDGRQVYIQLTDKGADLRADRSRAKWAWVAQAIAQLSKEEQAVLFEASGIIKRLAEK
jgi:DNA-binding MarR family transcriptional regulator